MLLLGVEGGASSVASAWDSSLVEMVTSFSVLGSRRGASSWRRGKSLFFCIRRRGRRGSSLVDTVTSLGVGGKVAAAT